MNFNSVIEFSPYSCGNSLHTSTSSTNYFKTTSTQDGLRVELSTGVMDSHPISLDTVASHTPTRRPESSSHRKVSSHYRTETRVSGANRRRQIQIPKGVASFQCRQCPKQFTRSSTLREHARAHTNERPFPCSICKKTFVRLKDRNRHENLHTGEKKFVCHGDFGGSWGCGRKFAREDALVAHFRNKIGGTCLRPHLDSSVLCLLMDLPGNQEESFVCEESLRSTAALILPFDSTRSFPRFGCEKICASYDDLEAHLKSNAGQHCIGAFLVDLAAFDARRSRLQNEGGNDRPAPESTPYISSNKATSAMQDPQVLEASLRNRARPDGLLEIDGVEAVLEQNSKTATFYSPLWITRMEGNSHGVSGSYVHIEVESLQEVPRAYPNFWELKFGDCCINPHDNRILRNGRKWMFLAPVPSFSETKCASVRVPLNFRIGWDRNGKNVLLHVGEFTYDYVDTVLR